MLKLRLERGDIVMVDDYAIIKVLVTGGQYAVIEPNARPGVPIWHLDKDGEIYDKFSILPQPISIVAGDTISADKADIVVHSHTSKNLEIWIEAPREIRIVTVKSDSTKQWKNARKAANQGAL